MLKVVLNNNTKAHLCPLAGAHTGPTIPLNKGRELVSVPVDGYVGSGVLGVCILARFGSTSLGTRVSHSCDFPDFRRKFMRILTTRRAPRGLS